MKFAIISDTHGNVANFRKAVGWLNNQEIQIILHCGDIGNPESLKESLVDFKGEFFGVFGNMDKDFKILIEEYNKIPRVEIKEDIFENGYDKEKEVFDIHKADLSNTKISDLLAMRRRKIQVTKQEKIEEQKKIEERKKLIEARKEELRLLKEKESEELDKILGGKEILKKKKQEDIIEEFEDELV